MIIDPRAFRPLYHGTLPRLATVVLHPPGYLAGLRQGQS